MDGMASRLASRDFHSTYVKRHERGCWIWSGTTNRHGYGTWGRKLAHRHAWEQANGPIPDGLWILHHCDNKPCVNPLHLYAGTRTENVQDAVDRGRFKPSRKDVCPKGHEKAGDNLIIAQSKGYTVYRCRICENERAAGYAREKRQARGLTRPRVSDEDAAQILELRRSGMAYRSIAATVGRSGWTVKRILKEAGL